MNKPCKLALAIVSALTATAGYAQQNTSTSPDAASADKDVEKIVVTSRGRTESLQQIPDAVTVISETEIRQAQISTIKDFSALTPNLDVSTNFRSGLNFITVRGLITPQVGEAPIAFVVDGVTVPNLEFINNGLTQIERIEVLRGPQGALYGKNAIGGAVNIITKSPSEDTEGAINLRYASGNDIKVNAAVSGAIEEDKLYYRLAMNYQDSDGLINNSFLNEKVDFIDGAWGIDGLLEYHIDDYTSLTLQANYKDARRGSNYMAFITADELEDFSIENRGNTLGEDNSKLLFASAKLVRELEAGELTIVASTNDADIEFFSDGDFTSQAASEDNFFFPVNQINPIEEQGNSLEVRYTSDSDSDLRWTVGGFWEQKDRKVSYDQVIDTTPTEKVTYADVLSLIATSPDLVIAGEKTVQDSQAYALFGQANYDINDALELTLALRYDSEKRDAYDERDRAASQAQETFSELQPKASLAWQYSEDLMLYSTYSRGFRSGGFNEYAPTVNRVYEEEISDTFEVGAKTTWLENRVWLNIAAFSTTQDNAQFTRLNPSTFTLENLNIDEVQVKGVELELSAKLSESFKLALGVGILDSEITKNTGVDLLSGRDLALTVGGTMPYVSDYNLNGSINYNTELSSGWLLNSRIAFNTMGPRSFDIFNADTGESDAHTFLNASVSIEKDNWSLGLFADNLADEESPETVFLYNPLIRMPNKPRQVGVTVSYKF